MSELQEPKHDLILKGLSEGLGFYEKQNDLNSAVVDSIFESKKEPRFSIPPSISELMGSETDLNLEDEKTYERLLFMLEKPWLGEEEEEEETGVKEKSKKASFSVNQTRGSHKNPDFLKTKEPDFREDKKKDKVEKNQSSFKDWTSQQIDKMSKNSKEKVTIVQKHKDFFSFTSFLTDTLVSGLLFFSPLVGAIMYSGINVMEALWELRYQIIFSFILFSQMYSLLCRLFCFETFGETLTDRRLYTGKNRHHPSPIRMFWRFLLSCTTGGISLPILSLIMKKDLLVYLTGLYFQKNSSIKEEDR